MWSNDILTAPQVGKRRASDAEFLWRRGFASCRSPGILRRRCHVHTYKVFKVRKGMHPSLCQRQCWFIDHQLRNGQLVTIPPILVRRLKSHFISLPCGVDLILGLNGYIWVSKHVKESDQEGEEGFDAEAVYSNQNDVCMIFRNDGLS